MKLPLVLALLALVVAGTGFFVSNLGDDEANAKEGNGDLALRLEQLSLQLTRLERDVEQLAAERQDRSELAPATRVPELSDDAVADAVARWMEANADRLQAAGAADVDPDSIELAELPVADLLEMVRDPDLTDDQRQELWARLSKAGRVDEVLAEMQRLAEASPHDPDLQVELGTAYLYKIFDVGQGPLAGEYAMKADAAFAKAIELDESHLEARFIKAVSLANWPAFLGKTPQAMNELETLIDMQSGLSTDRQFSEPYLVLGNLYMQTGERDRALAIWRDGLTAFPDNADLLAQLQLAEGQ